jgi:hypothetical protein
MPKVHVDIQTQSVVFDYKELQSLIANSLRDEVQVLPRFINIIDCVMRTPAPNYKAEVTFNIQINFADLRRTNSDNSEEYANDNY